MFTSRRLCLDLGGGLCLPGQDHKSRLWFHNELLNNAECFFAIGLDSYYLSTLMLAPGFAAMGFSLQNPAISSLAVQFTDVNTAFAIGVVVVLFMTAVLALRIKIISQVNRVLFFVSMIGVVVVFGLLALNSNATFIANFNQKPRRSCHIFWDYSNRLAKWLDIGTPRIIRDHVSVCAGLRILRTGANISGVCGWRGEIGARKTIPLALMGGFLFCGIMDWIGGELLMKTAGYDFLSASGYLFFERPIIR